VDQRSHEINRLSFAFPAIPTHETNRLILREVRAEHQRFLALKAPAAKARAFLQIRNDADWLQERMKANDSSKNGGGNICRFLLFDKVTGAPVGACGFHNWVPLHRRAEVGYALIDDRWKRQGIMTEALEFVIRFGFDKLNLIRIEACIGPWNEASIGLVKKFRFKEEGLMRQHYLQNGIPEDSLLFAILLLEYQTMQHL
jgi:ribosomal-protein-alanine N-acetyltransferase